MIGLITLLSVVLIISLIGWLVLKPEPQLIQGELGQMKFVYPVSVGRIQKFRTEEGHLCKKEIRLV